MKSSVLSGLVRAQPRMIGRPLGLRFKSSGGVGSFFEKEAPASVASKDGEEASKYTTNKDLLRVPAIQERVNPSGVPNAHKLLSPLKEALHAKVLEANNGVYVNNQVVELDGKKYKLQLTREEQKALEPTVYVQSYRIKSSWKKMYMFLRIFRRLPLLEAITQCHFSAKRRSTDIAEMLERGRQDAIKLGMNPEDMVISQIWVGKDGRDIKRLQSKGRGRTGVIKHPYVHIKAVLQDKKVLEQRNQWQKQRLDKKLWNQLRNWKIKEDYVQTAEYKW